MSEIVHAILEPYYKACDESRRDEHKALLFDIIIGVELWGVALYLLIHHTLYSFDALVGLAVLWMPALHYRRKML